MIDDLWDFDDPAGSEGRFRAAAEDAGPEESAVLLTQVARALGLQEKYAEAHDVLDRLNGVTGEAAVRAALERGRLHRSAGAARSAGDARDARDQAYAFFTEAARLARVEGEEGLHVDALHMLALLAETADAQITANQAALEVARAATDEDARRWQPSLLNNLGCALVDADRLDDALATFEEALELRRAQGKPRETQIAEWMVAWTLRLLGRHDEARARQLALKAELDAAGIDDPYVDEELALLAE